MNKNASIAVVVVAGWSTWAPPSAVAAVHSVPADYETIQAAVLAAQPGDVVEVAPGAYTEVILMKPGITLRSTHGPDSTRIEAPGSTEPATKERMIECVDPAIDRSTVIEGFFFDAMTFSGTGIYCEGASPTIRGNRFLACGWGVHLVDSKALIENNVFEHCGAFGILCRGSSPEIYSNTIRDTLSRGIAIAGKDSRPIIGGSREKANHFASNEYSIYHQSRNDIDATWNDWGFETTDEMEQKGYPADILTILDNRDNVKGTAELGAVDYRNWIRPEQAATVSTWRIALPVFGAVVLVALVVGMSRRRAAG